MNDCDKTREGQERRGENKRVHGVNLVGGGEGRKTQMIHAKMKGRCLEHRKLCKADMIFDTKSIRKKSLRKSTKWGVCLLRASSIKRDWRGDPGSRVKRPPYQIKEGEGGNWKTHSGGGSKRKNAIR